MFLIFLGVLFFQAGASKNIADKHGLTPLETRPVWQYFQWVLQEPDTC